MAVGQNHWYHFRAGEFTTHVRLPILVVGLGPLHWYGILVFDPWAFEAREVPEEFQELTSCEAVGEYQVSKERLGLKIQIG